MSEQLGMPATHTMAVLLLLLLLLQQGYTYVCVVYARIVYNSSVLFVKQCQLFRVTRVVTQ